MSNLSELLPAGSGAKVAEFVASGTLASGQTVALKTNGQVEAVSETAEIIGSATVFESGSAHYVGSAFDSSNNKVVIAYKDDSNSGYGTAVVGTVSGSSISFGSPVVFESANSRDISVTFDSNSNKIVIAYMDIGNNLYGTAIVGTVSGTSISFGTPTVYTSNTSYENLSVFDSSNNKVVIAYRLTISPNVARANVGTVSGTGISFGSAAEIIETTLSEYALGMTFDSNAGKVVVAYSQSNTSGRARVGTVSGTSISFGGSTSFSSTQISEITMVFDSNANKFVILYLEIAGNPDTGKAIVGTVSGTELSFGTAVDFKSDVVSLISASFDPIDNKVIVAYRDPGNSNNGTLNVGTVSGTSISFTAPSVFATSLSTGFNFSISTVFDSNANKTVITFDKSSGSAITYTPGSTNFADFLGITNAAISNSATGEVAVQGGVATNPIGPYALTVGSPNQFTSSTLTDPYTQVVYDSSNNKIVVLYRDSSNSSYGTAIVGTVSGTSISYGSPVIFEAAQSVLISATYDSNSNKVVVCYRDAGNSSYGTAIVGTVSGTSISFGTAAVFQSSFVSIVSSVQDSDTNKTIIAYRDNGNSNYGKSIVGTVSGTSISFGSAATFASSTVQYISIGYDATNSRAVIAYENGTNGKAIVGTVSGTSISFGSEATFLSGKESRNTTTTFDPSSGKVLIGYSYIASSAYQGTFGIVGTVSGTSISFGSEQYAFGAGYAQPYTDAVYDPDINKIILVASTSENSYAGGSIVATISGTSVSFGAFKLFDSSRTNYNSIAYDTTSNKSIIAYGADTNGGECVVGTASTAVILTIGTDYYVQDDGTLSTTTSTVPAGRALSTTSILLEG